jgi:hypothetical protein
MTSRLERWGERALGQARVLEPRIASRFEQAPASEPGIAADVPQLLRSPPRAPDVGDRLVERQPAVAPAAHAGTPRVPPPSSLVSRGEASRAPATPSGILVHHSQPLPRLEQPEARAARLSAPAEPQRSSPQTQARNQDREEAEPTLAPREPSDSTPRARARSLDAALARLQAWMEQSDERIDRDADEQAVPRLPAAPQREAAQPATPATAAPVALAPRLEPSHADRSAIATPPAPSRVEVHIGTIIVRSPSTQHSAPPQRPSPAAGLASFLARRTAGRL